MQPEEQRLHPLSILFRLAAQVRTFAVPGVAALVTAGAVGWEWQVWAMPLAIPFALISVVQYFSFRYRYDANEMVIRTGFLFRNERHVPYARIQNLHAVQNVFHRLLNVVEVRVETGGADEPEATMSVLPVSAFEEMRRRVFKEKGEPAPDTAAEPAAADETLLHLPPGELLLCGFIQNRGFVVIAAAFGLLWELGMLESLMESFFGEDVSGRGLLRSIAMALFGQGGLPLEAIALTAAAVVSLLLVSRLISMVWTFFRLYDFRLIRAGKDLRIEYGLLTRVATAISLRRIQTLTIRQGLLYRLFKRAAVRVEMAGDGGEDEEGNSKQREWLAPVIPESELPRLLHAVVPGLDLAAISWRGFHPRAFRRELKGWVLTALLISLPFTLLLKGWVLVLLAALLGWAWMGARLTLAHLGWAVSEDEVLYRSGWLGRQISVVRFNKIQAVTIRESPFDRRAAMASVAVDTAGAGESSHRVDIPYLARETARELSDLLTVQADRTAFRW
ncbi:MAG TPA: PH domain-containing protein [Thermoanaerobaculia bacterium]|nr:PH domain-containing protein [Thermoanaerobaculia bacterium]